MAIIKQLKGEASLQYSNSAYIQTNLCLKTIGEIEKAEYWVGEAISALDKC